MPSDAITPVQSVPQSLAAILSERKNRARLGLSKYAAEAAERAGESDGNLALSRNVRDVAAVHSTLWPAETQTGVFNESDEESAFRHRRVKKLFSFVV